MTKTEQTITNYIVGAACEECGEIINNNDLSRLQAHMLNVIYQNVTIHSPAKLVTEKRQ